MSDLIDRQAAIEVIDADKLIEKLSAGLDNPEEFPVISLGTVMRMIDSEEEIHTSQPEIIRCGECKHNPKLEWFGCPASHLSEKQKPDNAWCWKGERRTDETD